MARVNSQQWLQKWSTNLNAAGKYIQDGVARVQVAPGQAAAAASDRYLAGVNGAVNTWKTNVSKVSLQDWQNAMVKKGIPRLQTGTAQAVATKGAKIDQLLSAVDAAASAANQLPKGGLEQGIARATEFMRQMSARAPKKQGA